MDGGAFGFSGLIEENLFVLAWKKTAARIFIRDLISPSFRVRDYYVPTREPIPFLAAAVASAFPVILLVRIMLQVMSFPTDLYARDQFGSRTAIIFVLLGMLRTMLEGYHPVYILPLVGPLIVWYLCWKVCPGMPKMCKI